MARPLPIPIQKLHFLPASFTFFVVFTAVFSLFSVVTFMCGSHGGGKKTVRLGGRKSKAAMKEVKSRLTSKALLMAEMISCRKVRDGGAEEEIDEDGGAVWKKTIIKGEKCRPLDFSGRILYDSDGNLVPE